MRLHNLDHMIYQYVKMGAQLLIVGMGIFGNLYTMYCVFTKSKLQRVTNIFIIVISLALIVQAFNASIELTYHWDDRGYYIWSPMVCKIWQTMNVFLPSLMGLLCFFAILDRYLILDHPGIYSKIINSCTAVAMLLVSFGYSAGVSIPPIYNDWHTDDNSMPRGECKFKITMEYALLSPLVTFWIPVVLDIIIIVKLFKAIERHDRAVAILKIEWGGSALTKADVAAIERAAKALPWGEDQILRQHRLAISLWSIYWNISIFWIPQHVWQVMYKLTNADWPRVTSFIPWFGYWSSAILPVLFYYYDIYDI